MKLQYAELQESQIVSAKGLEIELNSQPVRYYRHGWQSWSLAAWTDVAPFPIIKPTILQPLQLDIAHAQKLHPNGAWLGAVELEDGKILLLGALATDAHVALVQGQLTAQSEAGEVSVDQEIQGRPKKPSSRPQAIP